MTPKLSDAALGEGIISFRRAVATDAKTQAKVKNGALNRKMLVWLKSESRRRLRNVACVSSRRGSALCKGVSCSINESAGASSVVIWGAWC